MVFRLTCSCALYFALIVLALVRHASSDECQPLCKFDADRTQECHVSREYAAALIKYYDRGPWGQLVSQQAACEAVLTSCKGTPYCEIDGTGTCSAKRSWVVERLAAPEADGGAGLNSDRCGIFGRLLVDGASCLPHLDKSTCRSSVAPSGANCVWDELRGICNAARDDVLFVLRRDYRDELARVSLRRERCLAANESLASCTGDCQIINGTCTLRTLDALLAVSGEDCPFSTVLRQNAGCWSMDNEATCTAKMRADGIHECDWRRSQCEAHPVALEFDLLLVLGLGKSEILEPMRVAQRRCTAFGSASAACDASCAPPVGPRSAASLSRPRLAMILLFGFAAGLRSML